MDHRIPDAGEKPQSPGAFFLGTQLSPVRGFTAMGRTARDMGLNTFQFFLRNPRGSRARALDLRDMAGLAEILENKELGFGKVLAHAPYTLNPCSGDPRVRELAVRLFTEDLARMEYLPGNYYNLHPGSRQDQGFSAAADQIAGMLKSVPARHTTVLLETMSGKGSEVGGRFEELGAIIEKAGLPPERLGVCFDSCHLWDAGYDIAANLDGVLEEFDRIVGLERLKAFHLNDSMNILGSRKDRHAPLGAGHIGLEAILAIVRHPALRRLPFVTETPLELPERGEEIVLLKTRL